MNIYRNLLTILSISTTLVLTSCGGEQKKTNEVDNSIDSQKQESLNKPTESENCMFVYDEASTELNWVAFKFTEKTAVGGKFDEVEVFPLVEKGSVAQIMEGLEFQIPVSSTNSSNPDRDAKIIEHFFGKMAETSIIKGSIVSINGTDENGEVIMNLTMNGQAQELLGSYTVEDAKLTLKSTVDLTKWGASDAVDALNKVCEDLHKGEDGVSKLWSEVEVTVSTTFQKDCQ